jgi:hypothetical protein
MLITDMKLASGADMKQYQIFLDPGSRFAPRNLAGMTDC